jgi:ATP-dependent Clp protease ATP-binding subunit ClpX
VELKFSDEALLAVAEEALKRKSGARGLRSILEPAMLEIMYELPSLKNVTECVVGEEVIISAASSRFCFIQIRPNTPR